MAPGTSLHLLASVSSKQKLLVDPTAAMKFFFHESNSNLRTNPSPLNLKDANFLSGTQFEIKCFLDFWKTRESYISLKMLNTLVFFGCKIKILRKSRNFCDSKRAISCFLILFLFRVCGGMTANRAQGQGFSKVGIYLKQDFFSHGQLYVAMSRATCPSGLSIFKPQDPNNPEAHLYMKNVVYKEIL